MNSKLTWWLVSVAAALGLYIYLGELHPTHSAERAQLTAKLLPQFDPAQVTTVEITRSNQVIRADRVDGQWRLAKPQAPAQPTAVDSFLAELAHLERQNEIPAQEIISQAGGLSPFGLDPPRVLVKLQAAGNTLQLRVGSKSVVGDHVYVQPVGAPGIYMVQASLLKRLPSSGNDWRDPMLLYPSTLTFDHIAVSTAGRSFKVELDSTNQSWHLIEPMQTRADFGLVQNLLNQMRTARISEFVTDDPSTNVEPFGLQPPEAELTLALGTNPVWQVQFGRSPTNDPVHIYARRVNQTNVVLVPREVADQVLNKSYTDFRDHSLLSFGPASLSQIEAHADEAFIVQRQGAENWQIVQPFRAPADPQLMQLFLEGLSHLDVIRFEKDAVADFAPYGLVKPQRQYLLKTPATVSGVSTNQLLLEADFGANPTNELDKVYARRSDELSVYVVNWPEVSRLPRAAFLLRDRRIWSFASSNVMNITVTQHSQKKELARDPATKKWSRDDEIFNAGLEETLHRLGELKADDWIALGEHDAKQLRVDGSEYQVTLDLTENGQGRKLTLNLRLGLSGRPYGAVALEQHQPVVFRFPVELYGWVMRFLSIPTESAEQ